ncbi:hypothetical protein RRG08_044527 [Elysia crispata]|uniref:Uncharacterized protein n=1 Tax=Elysia crispata TaxID=231223 RepID=A0AAE0ZBM8_9GAST|nr:hypothetical protein RRG08_044527 [Elysia crispata]
MDIATNCVQSSSDHSLSSLPTSLYHRRQSPLALTEDQRCGDLAVDRSFRKSPDVLKPQARMDNAWREVRQKAWFQSQTYAVVGELSNFTT